MVSELARVARMAEDASERRPASRAGPEEEKAVRRLEARVERDLVRQGRKALDRRRRRGWDRGPSHARGGRL